VFNILPSWFSFGRKVKCRKPQVQPAPYRGFRSLRHEQLEDRRMLATLTVSVADDSAADDDDGILTLREAMALAQSQALCSVFRKNRTQTMNPENLLRR